jgi:hypothetical protein
MNRLARLAAVEEISQCKARYCLAVDTKDWPGFGAVFTHDAIWDEGEFPIVRHPVSGNWLKTSKYDREFLEELARMVKSPVTGRAAIESAAREAADAIHSFHKLYVPRIEVLSEYTGKAEWPMEDVLRFPPGAPIRYLRGMGYYTETYQRVGDEWLIKTSKVSRLWLDIS